MMFSAQIWSRMWVYEMVVPKLGRDQVVHRWPCLRNVMLVEYQHKQLAREHKNILH